MKRTLLLISCVALLTLPGCFRILVPVSATWPKIAIPARPEVDIPVYVGNSDSEKALVKAAFQYKRHIEVLEKTIEAYNEEAASHNTKVEHELFGD